MAWSKSMIEAHEGATGLLNKIKDEAFDLMRTSSKISELDVKKFIVQRMEDYQLISGSPQELIVSFGKHTSNPHYTPSRNSSKSLVEGDLVMLDIWARLKNKNSPYGDITWMAYCGEKVPQEILSVFDSVVVARDESLKIMELILAGYQLPRGDQIEAIGQGILFKRGLEKYVIHSLGHAIGVYSPHGMPRGEIGGIDCFNGNKLIPNLGYTIEPGVYFKGKFGVRSEIDFFIDEDYKLNVTTKVQKNIVKV
ncbi:M24 family metallopeptidase [archaeon]|nr:M24 family metallopeptidase [archaeon]